jgi:hexosaminidase
MTNGTWRVICAMLFTGTMMASMVFAQRPELSLMPMPANVQAAAGSLKITQEFSVRLAGHTEPRLDRAVARFVLQLSRQTGISISPRNGGAQNATLVITTDHASKPIQDVDEDESYTLEVTATGAKLGAPTPLGTLHGLQTFLQLVDVSPDGFSAPAVTIQDKPRFGWRGLMIDSSRHFIPLTVIKRNLDGMEAVKLNVFHWHLSDNQGFRLESRKFPKLHEAGSDGQYYTQDEVRGLIEYARDRGIRVVPEFDLPGHSTAIFVGYPELAAGPGPYKIERQWGIFDPALDPTNEKTYKFLDQFVAEMAKLFPDHFFHVGGDEVNGKQWDANPKIQEFIKAHNLNGNEGLQAYFNKRLQPIVAKYGKSMIGWDEVLDPTLPKDIVIQSWRGQESLAAAAKQGFRGLLSNGYYIDLEWPAARHYEVDPMSGAAAALAPDEKQRILGGEATMWSEHVDGDTVDSRIWPRTAAIAERYWSPQEVRDPASMYGRMNFVSERLEWLGLTHRTHYRRMLQRIAGAATPEEFAALRTLADATEPVKDYGREPIDGVEATSETPLNRIVDAVPPESDSGRRFNELVNSYLGSSCNDTAAEARLRGEFAIWLANDAPFQSLAQHSYLARQAAGTSQDLSAVSATGIAALDLLSHHQTASDDWKTQQLAVLQNADKPKAQLLLVPAAGVRKLVEAASAGATCAAAKP